MDMKISGSKGGIFPGIKYQVTYASSFTWYISEEGNKSLNFLSSILVRKARLKEILKTEKPSHVCRCELMGGGGEIKIV